MVAGFIASLKVAVRVWLMGTAVAPIEGTTEMTLGVVAPEAVLKLHTKFPASAFPARSLTAVVMVAVNRVLIASGASGTNVATIPEQLTVPDTTVVAGPVRTKLVAGELSVVQSTGLLKVAVIAGLTGTPVAPLEGVVEVTVGGVVSGTFAVSLPHPVIDK